MNTAVTSTAERSCPVCGSRTFVHFADEKIDESKVNTFTYASRKQPEFMCLRLVRCVECDLVYAPNPPTQNFLSDSYSEASFDSAKEAIAAAISYSKALTPHIASLSNRAIAVDVGAGSGPLLPLLRDAGFAKVIGIEPSTAAIEAASPDVRPMLREGMFTPEMLESEHPSLLCSFMTLEHIGEPGDFARAVYDLLEPGGKFAVVVHDWRSPLNRILGLRSPIIDVEHLQLFSPKSIKALFLEAGFENISQVAITNAYPIGYWLRLSPLPAALKALIGGALSRIGLANVQIPLRVGNMMAVGSKPLEMSK
jgi:SAM-dependent methyltransferase